jgi:CheY-like chemotaxis protein
MRAMLDGALGGDIQVRMTFAPDLWPVEVDAGEMELAILNLCVNARDAMPGGGSITIDAANVDGTSADGAQVQQVKIAVGDTGRGMSPEVQARAFEPFFTTKDVSKGSGLGLPQVYGFAQQSGGRVEIHSAVGVGIVTILLPRSLRAPVARGGESADTASDDVGTRGRGSLLLVDDDPEVSVLACELLATLGFSVTHVSSGEAALQTLADGHHVDVVLSDIMMPGGVSGLQLAREVRRRHPRTRVVLTTGYVEAAADMADGEFTVLPKPVSLEALASALDVDVASE